MHTIYKWFKKIFYRQWQCIEYTHSCMHDDAPSHRAKSVIKYFVDSNYTVLEWAEAGNKPRSQPNQKFIANLKKQGWMS